MALTRHSKHRQTVSVEVEGCLGVCGGAFGLQQCLGSEYDAAVVCESPDDVDYFLNEARVRSVGVDLQSEADPERRWLV